MERKCTNCGQLFDCNYKANTCPKCRSKKAKETLIKKYGTDNPMHVPEFVNKIKSTM